MTDTELIAGYERHLAAFVRRSFLSHPSIVMVLEDMLRSDMVMLWELMGKSTQAAPFETRFGSFMSDVQARADVEPRVRHAVRAAIVGHLQRIEGYVPKSALG
jgi:hypothetical protein